MQYKRIAVAAAITGGVAAIAFGGQAVSTSWTQASSGNIHGDTATVSNTFQTGDLTLNNALPGDSSAPVTISYTNNGSTSETLVFSIDPSGSNLGLLANDLAVAIPSVGTVPLGSLPATYTLGVVGAGKSVTIPGVVLTLSTAAPVSDAGASLDAAYTLTATATHAANSIGQ